jgi:hypothetical protein
MAHGEQGINGKLDDFRVDSGALSAAQVAAPAQSPRALWRSYF